MSFLRPVSLMEWDEHPQGCTINQYEISRDGVEWVGQRQDELFAQPQTTFVVGTTERFGRPPQYIRVTPDATSVVDTERQAEYEHLYCPETLSEPSHTYPSAHGSLCSANDRTSSWHAETNSAGSASPIEWARHLTASVNPSSRSGPITTYVQNLSVAPGSSPTGATVS